MPLTVRFIACFVLFSCNSRPMAEHIVAHSGLHTVSGTLTTSQSYCGGAAPTPEMEAWYSQQRPLQCAVYVRKGATNDPSQPLVDSTVTDTSGRFTFRLPPGDYTLITDEQRDPAILTTIAALESPTLSVDTACLRRWFTEGTFQLKGLSADTSGLSRNFHKRCFVPYSMGCLGYSGPYPP